MSLFAEATRKAASARFKQPQLDAEGQQVEVGATHTLYAVPHLVLWYGGN